jgi:hypothetical protein
VTDRLLYDRGGGGYGRAWAQRWLNGHQTWAVPGPRLDPSRYGVAHVADPAARAFTARHHYLTSWVASTRRRYGLFDIAVTPARLVGVAVMAIPPNKLVLTNVFPTLEPFLNRGTTSPHSCRSRCRRPVGLHGVWLFDSLGLRRWGVSMSGTAGQLSAFLVFPGPVPGLPGGRPLWEA